MQLSVQALSRLTWLCSPALPIGAYAYSRGLEQAVTREYVTDAAGLQRWVSGVLTHQVATLDAPVMLRVRAAACASDFASVTYWSEFLNAHRDTRELVLEDTQVGGSLRRLLHNLGVPEALRLDASAGHAALFGFACAHFGITEQAALSGYLVSFAENQITAALKCLSLGQTAGQRVLHALMAQIDGLIERVLLLRDDELGSYAPGLSLLSALHETQYTRLFRS